MIEYVCEMLKKLRSL